MGTTPSSKPSFSPFRKWGIGIHVVLLVLVVFSVVVMVNYISRDYFRRFYLSTRTQLQLSPRTVGLLHSLTNRVNVTVYYDTEDEEALYSTVSDLLGEYRLVSPQIVVQRVDYVRNPTLAGKIKAKYKLSSAKDKNLVIFDYQGKVRTIDGNALGTYVLEQVTNAAPSKALAFRRKPAAFLGEMAFTAALLDVTSPKSLKAYFLQDHGESQMEGGDQVTGYVNFTSILQHQNGVQCEPLSLLGTNTVPADCNLLVIAGPQKEIPVAELRKIDHYLSQGGRLLALFNFASATKPLGLETLLSTWGVDVGRNLVADADNTQGGSDVIVNHFGKHPIVESLRGSALQLSMPRSVGRLKGQAEAADAPRVEELGFTGPRALAVGDQLRMPPIPLMVAVEKGGIKDVITERGSTRIVVCGDSQFLGNAQIDFLANRDFAANAVNWLLERSHMLAGVGPRPVLQYRVVMTQAQLHQSQWVLLGVLPGSVLVLGGLVWLRRRR